MNSIRLVLAILALAALAAVVAGCGSVWDDNHIDPRKAFAPTRLDWEPVDPEYRP